jgi:O-antigen ligase
MTTLVRRLAARPVNSRALVRWLIIGAVLVLAVVLARQPSSLVVLLPLAVVGGWLIMRQPGLGPPIVVGATMLVGFSLGTGTQTSLPLAVIMVPALTGLWLARWLVGRTFRFTPSPANLPLVGLVITAVISFLAGNLPWLVFGQTAPLRSQIGAVAVFVFSAAAFFLVANEVKSERWLKATVWAFLGAGALFLLNRVNGAPFRALGINFADGSMVYMCLVAMSASQLLFNRALRWPARLFCLALAAGTLAYSLSPGARDWASGWVPEVIVLGVLVWLRWPRLGTVFAAAALVAVLLNYSTLEQLVLSPSNAYSLLTREAAWEIVLEIFRANPLLGVGPANYYWYTTLYPILGWYVRFNSHNQYMDVLAQTGLLGMAFLAWFALALAWQGWRLRSHFKHDFGSAYVNASLAAIAGAAVAGILGDWLLPFVYNVGISGMRASLLIWLFLGGLVALGRIAAERHQADGAAEANSRPTPAPSA